MPTYTISELMEAIEDCLVLNSWEDARFGREFNGDPNFVRDLRLGRKPGARIRTKLTAFLNQHGCLSKKK